MALIHVDSFAGFRSADQLSFQDIYESVAATNLPVIQYDPLSVGYISKSGLTTPVAGFAKDIAPTGLLRFSTEVRTPVSGAAGTGVFFFAGIDGVESQRERNSLASVWLSFSSSRLTYTYRLLSNIATGAASKVLTIMHPDALIGSNVYNIECEIDHRNPTARVRIRVNGVMIIDQTYDRATIDGLGTGTPANQFSYAGMSFNSNNDFRHFVLWDDTPGGLDMFPTPSGLTVDELKPTNAALGTTTASLNDAATVLVNSPVAQSFDFEDPVDPSKTIYDASFTIRANALNGTEMARIIATLKMPGVADSVIDEQMIAGFSYKRFDARLPSGLTAADLSAATLELRRG